MVEHAKALRRAIERNEDRIELMRDVALEFFCCPQYVCGDRWTNAVDKLKRQKTWLRVLEAKIKRRKRDA